MSSLENFQAIQKIIFANRERKMSISEISRIASINRNQVKRLIQRYDNSDELSEFIVDGRKSKFLSEPIIPKTTGNNESKTIDTKEIQNEEGQTEKVQTEDFEDEKIQFEDIQNKNIQIEDVHTVNVGKERTLMYSELYHRENEEFVYSKETRKFVFDSTITELSVSQFSDVLYEIVKKGIKPRFCLYSNDVLLLDMKKKGSKLAKELLKFFAQDSMLQFHELLYTEKPNHEFLAQVCSQNNYTLISGNARNILWCKLYQVDVIVPTPFKEIIPNPCQGKGIVGLDSCMLEISKGELDRLLKKYKSILISDIQLEEIKERKGEKGEYLLNLVAYYGDVRLANRATENADKNICIFYSQNNVEAMYTVDYGCYLFGKLSRVNNCTLYKHPSSSESRFLSILNQLPKKYDEIKVGDVIILDEVNILKNAYVFDWAKFSNISIFSPAGKKRKGKVRNAYSQDYLTIYINQNIIVIAQITKQQKARVCFYGFKSNVPTDLKKFLD